MTHFTRARLRPLGPFHFGGRGVGMERSDVWLPADSLFSAICNVMALQQGAQAVEAMLEDFLKAENSAEIPFRLTSLMPYAGDVMLLPYPMIGPPPVRGTLDLRRRKEFKAIRWASLPVFRKLAQNKTPEAALRQESPLTIHDGTVWLTEGEHEALRAFAARHAETGTVQAPVLWRTHQRPRVTIDRRTSASAVYALGSTHFNRHEGQQAGLYTMVEWVTASERLQQEILAALETLGQIGIGGKRSSGFGQFELETDRLSQWTPGAEGGEFFTTLSPYHPRPEEAAVVGPGARYEISLRRGWLSLAGFQNLRRASVRMIADGSVLRWPPGVEPVGDLAPVAPQSLLEQAGPQVYRYGLAFPVGIDGKAMTPTAERPEEVSAGGVPAGSKGGPA